MKIVWEADDIVPGRVVGKADRSERWMIGYRSDIKDPGPSDRRYVLVSLADGMVTEAESKDSLAAVLNRSGDQPRELSSQAVRGRRGAVARAQSLTGERRSEIAAGAANARWNGEKKSD